MNNKKMMKKMKKQMKVGKKKSFSFLNEMAEDFMDMIHNIKMKKK